GTLVRSVDTSPPVSNTYTVVKGDSMWLIAHKFLGDGSRYKELYNMNKSVIDAGNKGTGNPTYTIYPGQVFRLS
ncbi:MAG: LysM peptidoglycan-binding domain-containing protein, partial [Oscillospiraceae bacterium]|nr:LysM peptidoglycan-binding domain-containing protein [Oscillospiraceae bacterium]